MEAAGASCQCAHPPQAQRRALLEHGGKQAVPVREAEVARQDPGRPRRVQGAFGAPDERLAASWHRAGIPLVVVDSWSLIS